MIKVSTCLIWKYEEETTLTFNCVLIITYLTYFNSLCITDMLNIPQATKPSVDIHVVLPHRISKFIMFTNTSSEQYSILYHIKFDNIVNLSIAINESISFV